MARKSGPGKGNRDLTVRVKTAKGRKLSSTLWLQRQLNDPYVVAAQREGYRSRAVYKLQEIDDKYRLLRPGMRIIDLGAAPGGWSQLCAKRVKAGQTDGQVIAVDLQEIDPLQDVTTILCDFEEEDAPEAYGGVEEDPGVGPEYGGIYVPQLLGLSLSGTLSRETMSLMSSASLMRSTSPFSPMRTTAGR